VAWSLLDFRGVRAGDLDSSQPSRPEQLASHIEGVRWPTRQVSIERTQAEESVGALGIRPCRPAVAEEWTGCGALRQPTRSGAVTVVAGMRLRVLTAHLGRLGRAMDNICDVSMPVGGAVATGVHGTPPVAV